MADNNHVITVELSNNDRFYFSWKYDEEHLKQYILESLILYNSFIEIPVLPQFASQIQEDIIRRSIHGTAAIEGNPLSEEDVQIILEQSDITTSVKRADQEIINLKNLYHNLRYTEQFCELTNQLIVDFHATVLSNITDKAPGQLRSKVVRVGDASHGGIYKPPSRYNDIKHLMKEFNGFINAEEICALDVIIRGALAHYHLALIHPFEDGNGRTARFLEAYIIRSGGMRYVPALLSNYYYRHMDEYYWAFSLSEKSKEHDITPFLDFVYKGVIESLRDVKERIYKMIRLLSLRDLYSILRTRRDITQHQHDLLMALTGTLQAFYPQELFTNPIFSIIYRATSERTTQRDLKKLVNMDLLKKNEDGTYELNLRALG